MGNPRLHHSLLQLASSPFPGANPSIMTEFEELAKLKEWEGLLDTLRRERKASFRQILAAHASACCSPDHQPQMVSSLKVAGLDDPLVLEEKTGPTYSASMSLDPIHQGLVHDSLRPVSVASSPQPKFEKAQEQAGLFALAFLLSVGTDQVRLHPNSLANGVRSVAALREAGHKVSHAAGPPASGTWREWMQQLPAAAPIEVVTVTQLSPTQVNTEVVMEALLSQRKRNLIDPSRLPPQLRHILEEHVPKKGLKRFLMQHSDKFEVHEGSGNAWTFSIKRSTDPSAPTTGWSDQPSRPGSSSDPLPPAPAPGWRGGGWDWNGGTGLTPGSSSDPLPPPPPGLTEELRIDSWRCATQSWQDDRSSWRGSDEWARWGDWKGWTSTKEWNWSGGSGRAGRDAPHPTPHWNEPTYARTWNHTSSSHTELGAADLVNYGLLRPEALVGGGLAESPMPQWGFASGWQ